MDSRKLAIHVAALSYLVTLLIQRCDETDLEFSQRPLKGIASDRKSASSKDPDAGFVDRVFEKALQIVGEAAKSVART